MKKLIIELISKEGILSEEEAERIIKEPKDFNDNGDYSLPCYIFKKKHNKDADLVAGEIADRLKGSLPFGFERVEAKGSYVNFFVNKKIYALYVLSKVGRYCFEGHISNKEWGRENFYFGNWETFFRLVEDNPDSEIYEKNIGKIKN